MAISEFQNTKTTGTASIASGASLSAVVPLGGTVLTAIVMPAVWTTANLTFQASADNSAFNDVYTDAGVEYSVTAAGARYIVIDPADFAGIDYLKIRSGTTGTAVNQTAARTLTLMVRPL